MKSIVLLICLICTSESDRILGILPYTSYSHHQPIIILLKHLAHRGHNITVITSRPIKVSTSTK